MDKEKAQRLQAKYGGKTAASSIKKEISLGPKGRDQTAMAGRGKPKALGKTILRLFQYLSHERLLITIALICTLLNTISTLASSYMLRPIMNQFIYYDPDAATIPSRMSGLFSGLCLMAAVYAV